ncbi:hypothetical protein [Larkinella rosea]|uniref:Glycosyltransferase RgtA/B/C/D-like domain-containing protein n=1 Tax=Larkinella rosea TaxID=2025312 RepID=A0A3P1BAM4_9BACT|nr:hypothetical protein [Larkinella rosea]RRA97951.1 hypothetical protein EHT25_30200 [Larkinella rosea]
METVVYALPFRLFIGFLLVGWSFILGWKVLFRDSFPNLSGRALWVISFLLFIGIRILYAPDREQNIDTSTWMATALTVGKASDPLYTLLNYSDGRPLAVLPLAIAELIGIPLDYRLTDLIGVLLWCITLWLFGRILKKYLAEEMTLALIWLPLLLLSMVWNDFASFNTEVTGNLWLILGLSGLLRIREKPVWAVAGIGFWLGCLPFVKFQTVPMGVVLGLLGVWKLYQARRFSALPALLIGALLPVLLLTAYYAGKNDLDSFWGDYFSNYFVYSYTTEYSDLSPGERFSPVRIVRYLLHSYQFFLYWIGIFGAILVGLFMQIRRPVLVATDQKERFWFGLIWLVASFYAVLQAGNNYTHYLLFLVFPSLFLLSVLCSTFDVAITQKIILVILGTVLAQASINCFFRKPLDIHPGEPLFQRISAEIQNRSQPDDGLVLWGYVDRLHAYSRRPMGYRNSNAFWVYYPTSTQAFRMKEFLSDLEQNKPRLFVDVMTPRISMFADKAYQFENYPLVKNYISQHYQLVKTIEDVRIFERKPAAITN